MAFEQRMVPRERVAVGVQPLPEMPISASPAEFFAVGNFGFIDNTDNRTRISYSPVW